MGLIERVSATLQAIFFDVDGVLIDSVDIKGDCFVRVFSDFPDKRVQIRDWHERNGGVNREDKIRSITKEVIGKYVSDVEIAKRVKEYENLVVSQVILAPEIPGAGLALRRLKGKVPLFATSATPQDELKRILIARGDEHFFSEIFGWPTTKKTAITSVLEKYSLSPLESVLIGDSAQDFEAARAAGVRFILVTGQSNRQICDADASVKDLTKLLPALAQVVGTD